MKLTICLLVLALVACGGGEPELNGDGVYTQALHSYCDVTPVEMLTLVNEARAEGRYCGSKYYKPVQPLVLSDKLNSAADIWSKDMALHNTPAGHIDSLGRQPQTRANAVGYKGLVGENSAAGQSKAAHVMIRFLESEGHCKNLMLKEYKEFGTACTKTDIGLQTYWVQNFGIPF